MAFYRSYDASIGRWMQVDPLSEKYYSLTPYNGMGNNPVLITDPMGDSLKMNFLVSDAKKGFDVTVNMQLEGQFEVSHLEGGFIDIVPTSDESSVENLTKEGRNFYNYMKEVIDDESVTEFDVYWKDRVVTNGAFDEGKSKGRLDMADISAFDFWNTPNNRVATRGSKLIHEVYEQFQKTRGIKTWRDAHPYGMKAEREVQSAYRFDGKSEMGAQHYFYDAYNESHTIYSIFFYNSGIVTNKKLPYGSRND